MSRREEVKAEIGEWASDGDGAVQIACLRNRCRTLSGEVDARDAVITKMLEMCVPCKEREDDSITQRALNGIMDELYNRALEIAGRKDA